MYLIQTSADLLNIVKAFIYLWVGVFFAWFIYYLAMMMRQAYLMTRDMRERVKKVDEAIKAFKEKIEHSTSYLLLIGEGIKKLVEVAREYGGEEKKKKRKK